MLNAQELANCLARVSYWRGWKMYIVQNDVGPGLRIVFTAPDADDQTQTTDIGINDHIPPCRDEIHFYEWLDWRLEMIAKHEHQEAFKVDGDKWFDPHEEHEWPRVWPTRS